MTCAPPRSTRSSGSTRASRRWSGTPPTCASARRSSTCSRRRPGSGSATDLPSRGRTAPRGSQQDEEKHADKVNGDHRARSGGTGHRERLQFGRRQQQQQRLVGARAVVAPSPTSRARTTATSSGPLVDKWNAAHPNEKVTFKEQSDQADQQHDDLVQHFQAKDSNYDVVDVDVVWTAEFAAKGWLQPLKDKLRARHHAACCQPTVKAATYNDTLYAAPHDLRRRPALLPQGPGPDAAEDAATR